MYEYRVDLTSVLESVGTAVEIEADVDFGTLMVGDEEFASAGPSHVSAQVSNVGSGFAAFGTVSMPARATCARCLCTFPLTIEGEIEGLYLLPGQVADEAEEAEYVAADGSVDLGPAIHAALVIAAPFVPLHDEACAGLCPTCGGDLNDGPCACAEATPPEDHPFAKLKELLADSDDEPEHS